MIERKIIIGMIVSTDYIRQIHHVWDIRLLSSNMAKRLATWCMEYYEKYNKAPVRDIEGIYFEKIKTLPKDIAEEIEQDILPSLSDEFIEETFNLNYLLDQTFKYFKERQLTLHTEEVQALLDKGRVDEAEQLTCNFKVLPTQSSAGLDLSNEIVLERLEKAFAETGQPIVKYGGALGDLWNAQLTRGSFVALMGSSKRGKSYWLLDFAMRGCRQGAKVAFFQAGDMTEDAQLIRISTYLTNQPRLRKYCGESYEPIKDCVWNQVNLCNEQERDCNFGVFEGQTERWVRSEVTIKELKQQYSDNPDYTPCCCCEKFKGAVWLKKLKACSPMTINDAKQAVKKYFIESARRFKISTHSKGTLSVRHMQALLDVWEKQEDFIPDLIIVDYADVMASNNNYESFRHRQDDIWGNLRGLSMEKHCLVVTGTQADARSFEQGRLKPTNFSEDKRKLDHVTAMYGLNQDVHDREKRIGIMRINELVVREGDYSVLDDVIVLQNIARGQPCLKSFL